MDGLLSSEMARYDITGSLKTVSLDLYSHNLQLWVDTGTKDGDPFGHPYAGYYLPYPDSKHEGLVTTITDVAPIMNWVYVDKLTHEVKFGVRVDAQPNLTGPFDCTRQDRRLTFDGWEGWCAVEEMPNMWALYFDVDDDGLQSKVAPGTRVLEIELTRKEKRWKKDGEERQKDQTTKRAVETKEDAPVDNPVTSKPELTPPGVGVPTQNKAPEPLRPFGLPKSIFSDPPRPLFFGQEMLSPKSPPPAYTYEIDVLSPVVESFSVNKPKNDEKRAETPPPLDPAIAMAEETVPARTPQRAPAQQKESVSRADIGTPPLPPIPSRVTPPSEKRPTPKLNRNSGTRTLAQAQMFEAWARDKAPPADSSRTNKSPSRPASNSGSEYSVLTRVVDETADEDIFSLYNHSEYGPLPSARPSLETARQQQEKKGPPGGSDPAVFARLSSGSSTTSDPAVAKDKPQSQPPLRRTATAPVSAAPKQSLPPVPGIPGVFTQRRNSPDPGASRSTPQSQRQASISARTRATPADPPRRGSPVTSREPARSTSRPSLRTSKESLTSRPRNGSTSSLTQNDNPRSSPRPITRTNTATIRDRSDRGKTASSLYREIDDLVRTPRNRSGSAASNTSSRNDSRADSRQPTLRRTMTAREPQKGEVSRSAAGAPRDAGVRPERKGEK